MSYVLIPSSTNVVTAFAIFDSYKSNIQDCKEHMLRFPNFFKSIERMNEIFEKVDKPKKIEINKDTLIKIENLSFSYEDENDILKDVNIEIKNNEKIALIGDNGSGKTTLLRLILGLYSPKSGNVYINGTNSEALENDARQELFSYIPIASQLFSESISRNVEMGYTNTAISQKKIDKILKNCHLSLDINSIATSLSGGEATRVNIARGTASTHKIIIADELLASLDKENRERILKYLISLDCCIIMTIHNKEYLQVFDRVIDLSNAS